MRTRAVVGRRIGARRELDPDGVAVGAAQAQQVVVDRAVGGEALEQRDARLRIDEAIAIEGADVGLRRFAGVAEDQLEVGVGGDRRRRTRDRSSRCRRLRAPPRTAARTPRRVSPRGIIGRCGDAFRASMAARMSRTDAPERCASASPRARRRCRSAQSMPCGSHSVTSPLAARAFTKQSSLPRWPLRWQPQKHGT